MDISQLYGKQLNALYDEMFEINVTREAFLEYVRIDNIHSAFAQGDEVQRREFRKLGKDGQYH